MTPHRRRCLARDRGGVAAVEAALALGLVLIPLCLALVDYGMALADAMRLDRALQAAAFYVWSNPSGFTAAGITSAGTAGFGTATPAVSVTSSSACFCVSSGYSKGASVSCTGSCSGGGAVGSYVTITASHTFTLPVRVPHLASSLALSISGTIRTQ